MSHEIRTVDDLVEVLQTRLQLMGRNLSWSEILDVVRAIADLSVDTPLNPQNRLPLEVVFEYGVKRRKSVAIHRDSG